MSGLSRSISRGKRTKLAAGWRRARDRGAAIPVRSVVRDMISVEIAPALRLVGPAFNEPCLMRLWQKGGTHPLQGLGARGRRSERTQGMSPWLSVIPPRIHVSPNG